MCESGQVSICRQMRCKRAQCRGLANGERDAVLVMTSAEDMQRRVRSRADRRRSGSRNDREWSGVEGQMPSAGGLRKAGRH